MKPAKNSPLIENIEELLLAKYWYTNYAQISFTEIKYYVKAKTYNKLCDRLLLFSAEKLIEYE